MTTVVTYVSYLVGDKNVIGAISRGQKEDSRAMPVALIKLGKDGGVATPIHSSLAGSKLMR